MAAFSGHNMLKKRPFLWSFMGSDKVISYCIFDNLCVWYQDTILNNNPMQQIRVMSTMQGTPCMPPHSPQVGRVCQLHISLCKSVLSVTGSPGHQWDSGRPRMDWQCIAIGLPAGESASGL